MTATEYIILVDEHDQETGTAEKLAAHEKNQLHRAFSIFIFRDADEPEILLQQRAAGKYHCPLLWTNTCCSHPHPGETVLAAGGRRLQEELGFTTSLIDLGWFHYNVRFENGLSENEIDHVLIGKVSPDLAFTLNPDEIKAVRWVTIGALESEMEADAAKFTPWLRQALGIVKTAL
jgi:isopentenyl-diphosphate delta-isomerase type 1